MGDAQAVSLWVLGIAMLTTAAIVVMVTWVIYMAFVAGSDDMRPGKGGRDDGEVDEHAGQAAGAREGQRPGAG